MYLSTLLIDVGDNPDRPRPGRVWLRNRYRVHQRLCMAFPSKARADDDPDFLKPYDPAQFGDGHVHVARGSDAGFLFHVEPCLAGRVVILVLSAMKPDWNYAFGLKPGLLDDRGRPIGNAGHLLAAPPSEPRQLNVEFKQGARFRFRLQANPTRKVHALPEGSRRTTPLTKNGRRVPVPATEEALRGWLGKQADRAGFRVEGEPLVQPGYVYVSKDAKPGQGHRLRSVLYEGILEVTDADKFAKALAAGIGPAKGYGFGLLSVAPIGS